MLGWIVIVKRHILIMVTV